MQDMSGSKEAVRLLKAHDTFLTEVRLLVERDQENLRGDIDEKMQLVQIVLAAKPDKQGCGRNAEEKGPHCQPGGRFSPVQANGGRL